MVAEITFRMSKGSKFRTIKPISSSVVENDNDKVPDLAVCYSHDFH